MSAYRRLLAVHRKSLVSVGYLHRFGNQAFLVCFLMSMQRFGFHGRLQPILITRNSQALHGGSVLLVLLLFLHRIPEDRLSCRGRLVEPSDRCIVRRFADDVGIILRFFGDPDHRVDEGVKRLLALSFGGFYH